MAVSKVILNGTTLIDVTDDTVAADKVLYGYTATKNDGTEITGSIASKTSADLTVSGGTVTAPAGAYASDASASVASGTITNNTSGGTSSGTINRGSQIKIGAGYYSDDAYYEAQANSGTVNISQAGTTSVDGYASASVASGAYSASVSSHSISTTPVVTADVSSSVTNITTTTQPSGTDGTDYWTITPSGSVTTTGVSTAQGTATVGTAGYVTTGSTLSSEDTVSITPTVTDGTAQYITKGTITNNTSGGTSSGTINRGYQIKVGAGYYSADAYYEAQANSGRLILTTADNAYTNISCDGYQNVSAEGINLPYPASSSSTTYREFQVQVPNGNSTIIFKFRTYGDGRVVVTET